MNSTKETNRKASFSTQQQRARRKIAREVAAMYDDIARAAGFEPIERRAAWAITIRLYERAGEDCETPREIALATIGKSLTSRSDDQKACADVARRRCGQLFNHAIPRTGFQILTRYKAPEDQEEEKKRPHAYADHLTPVAAFFSELLAEETETILSTKGLDKPAKREKIAEARTRLVAEALDHLPRCDSELVTPEGESYAYLSEPEAGAYCKINPGFTHQPFTYEPPTEPEPPGPLTSADFERLKRQAISRAIDQVLDLVAERNSEEEAAKYFRQELLPAFQKAGASWIKVRTAPEEIRRRREFRGKIAAYDAANDLFGTLEFDGDQGVEEEEQEELIHRRELRPLNPEAGSESTLKTLWKTCPDRQVVRPPKLRGLTGPNSFPDNAEKNESQKIDPVENLAPAVVGSINFDESLEAAIFYAQDGWPVLPICQFDLGVGRCTASWHGPDCAGKKPLVKGKGDPKPGDGYTGATRDLAIIRKWYEIDFPDAGVGLRLDGKVLIDADLKDGGPASYEFVRDTFDLPETLTQATQSGGGHHVFRLLPESQELLKSWTRVLDKIALPGIDLKVGKRGLLYAEPTRGKKGVYRWIDPTVEPATLPHEAAEFFHSIRYQDEQKAEKSKTSQIHSPSTPAPFDPDQAKFFRDVPRGERHGRLLKISRSMRAAGATAMQIEAALAYHASRFSDPLDDPKYIARVARECELKFAPEVMR